LAIDGAPRRVIGILPEDFRFLNLDPDLILPQRFAAAGLRPDFFNHPGVARLRSGISLEQANEAAAAGIRSGGAAASAENMLRLLQIVPDVHPLQQDIVGDAAPVLWLLVGAVGIGLLLACANVANLFLTRTQSRRQELVIRAALGAGWGRIARELLVEGLIVGLLAGAIGLALAVMSVRLLVVYGPTELPRLRELGVDGTVASFGLACSLGCSLFFALIPMIRCANPAQLQQQRGSGRSAEQRRTQDALVVVQVALALVLLIGSGLMIRTCLLLLSVDPGVAEPQSVQMFRLSIPKASTSVPTRLQESILQRLAAIPGVSAVGFTNAAPLDLDHQRHVVVAVEGRTADGQMPPSRSVKAISPGYLAAQGTPLLAGREFGWSDLRPPRPVALVSASMARLSWGPDLRQALGQRIRVGRDGPLTEVVGIVSEVRELGVEKPPPAVVYLPATDLRAATFALRSHRAGTAPFLDEVVRAVHVVHPGLPVTELRTLGEVYRNSMARPAFTLVLLGIAGSLSLALSLVGVYGLLAYSAAQRRPEIGIRMALGATSGRIAALFLRRGLFLTLAGIGAGLVLALLLCRWMETHLFGVAPHDALTYAAAAGVLLAASVGACAIPSLRAGQADPAKLLRSE
jgi:predicted permease